MSIRTPADKTNSEAEKHRALLEEYRVIRGDIELQITRDPKVLRAFKTELTGLEEIEVAYHRQNNLVILDALVDAATALFEKIEEQVDRAKRDDFERYGRLIAEKICAIRRFAQDVDVEPELAAFESDCGNNAGLFAREPDEVLLRIILLYERVKNFYWRVRPRGREISCEIGDRFDRELRWSEFQKSVIAEGAREGQKFSVRILGEMIDERFVRIPGREAQKYLGEKDPSGCGSKYFALFAIVNPDYKLDRLANPDNAESIFYFSKSYDEREQIPTALPPKFRGEIYAFVNQKLIDRGNGDLTERVGNTLFPLSLTVLEAASDEYRYWSVKTHSPVLDEQYLYFHEHGFLPVNSEVVKSWIQKRRLALPWGHFVVLYGVKTNGPAGITFEDGGDRLSCFCRFIDKEGDLAELKTSDQLVGPRIFAIQQFMDMVAGCETTENVLSEYPPKVHEEKPRDAKIRMLSRKLGRWSWIPASKDLVDFWGVQREADGKSGFLNVLRIAVPGEREHVFFATYSTFPVETPEVEGTRIVATAYHIVPYVTGGGVVINHLIPVDFAGKQIKYLVKDWNEAAQVVMAKADYMKAHSDAQNIWSKSRCFPYVAKKFWIALIHPPGEAGQFDIYFSIQQDGKGAKLPEGICGRILEYDVINDNGRHSLDTASARTVFERQDINLTSDPNLLLQANKIDAALPPEASDEFLREQTIDSGEQAVTDSSSPAVVQSPDQSKGESSRKVYMGGRVLWICAGVASAALLATGIIMNLRGMRELSMDDEGTFAKSGGGVVPDAGARLDASVSDAALPDAMTPGVLVPDAAVSDLVLLEPTYPVIPGVLAGEVPKERRFVIDDRGIQHTLREGLEEELAFVASDLTSWQLREEVREAVHDFALERRRLGNPLEDDVYPGQKLDLRYRWDGSGGALIIEDVDLRPADQKKSIEKSLEKSPNLDLNSLNSGDVVLYTPHPKKNQKFEPEPRPHVVVGPSRSTPPGLILRNPGTGTEFAISAARVQEAVKLVEQQPVNKKFLTTPVTSSQERIYFAEKDGGLQNLLVNYFVDAKGLDKPFAMLEAKKMLAKARNIPDLKMDGGGKPVAVYKTLWNLNLLHVGDSIVVEDLEGEYRIVALDKQWPNKLTF